MQGSVGFTGFIRFIGSTRLEGFQGLESKGWVLLPLSNSWIYKALNGTTNIDCYWVGAVPKVKGSGICRVKDLNGLIWFRSKILAWKTNKPQTLNRKSYMPFKTSFSGPRWFLDLPKCRPLGNRFGVQGEFIRWVLSPKPLSPSV